MPGKALARGPFGAAACPGAAYRPGAMLPHVVLPGFDLFPGKELESYPKVKCSHRRKGFATRCPHLMTFS